MFNKITKLINEKKNLFITGSAGTGKSYYLNNLMDIYPDLIVTASTGAAAVKVFGQTIHSFSGIGLGDLSAKEIFEEMKFIRKEKIKRCSMLAIDEISMLNGDKLNLINEVFQLVKGNSLPFGGIQVILIGDFLQLPPVDDNCFFAFQSQAWKDLDLQSVLLTKIYRQNEACFLDILNEVRYGELSKPSIMKLNSFVQPYNEDKFFKLYALNKKADNLNLGYLNALEGKEQMYTAYDIGENRGISLIHKNCLCPKRLILKVDARVMLLKNVSVESGLVNGALGTVKQMCNRSVVVEFDNGITEELGFQPVSIIKEDKLEIARRDQIPLRLSWAISIHKSQGMTLDNVVVDMDGIFEYGQAYVALSRVKSMKGLRISHLDISRIKAHPEAIKFYKELCRHE